MNIFYLSHLQEICVVEHVDKHVRKMVVEYAQILSTAHRLLDGIHYNTFQNNRKKRIWVLQDKYKEALVYKAAYYNHPSSVWARESKEQYEWLAKLWVLLLNEYEYRFGKVHATKKLVNILKFPPDNLKTSSWRTPSLAMPEEFQNYSTAIECYRAYYIHGKSHLHQYTKRQKPEWLNLA